MTPAAAIPLRRIVFLICGSSSSVAWNTLPIVPIRLPPVATIALRLTVKPGGKSGMLFLTDRSPANREEAHSNAWIAVVSKP